MAQRSRRTARPAPPPTPAEEIRGRVERIRFYRPDTGYAVFVLSTNHGDTTAAGNLFDVREKADLILRGAWVEHPKFGRQFSFTEHEVILPRAREGIVSYLAATISGIGPVKAARIADALGEDALEIIKTDPDRLRAVSGITPEQVEMIIAKVRANETLAELSALICGEGITPNLAAKICAKYGAEAVAKVKENPYILADELRGIGFITADKIARGIGIAPDAPFRVQAAVLYLLNVAGEEGHVYLRPSEIVTQLPDITGAMSGITTSQIAAAVGELIRLNKAIREENRVYLVERHRAEVELAAGMKRILAQGKREVPEWATGYAEELAGITYADSQKVALEMALASPLSIVTGGPGTGKSTILRGIVAVYEKQDPEKPIYLAAPTGRAAKRITETTGREASTIHRLLAYHPEFGFQHNADNPLPAGLLVVDEGCFHWKTPILLANGTWEYIGKIVNHHMNKKVMSYNPATGRLEPRQIKQWWKYERKSPFLEINASRNGSTRRGRIIRCTPQHMIATPTGYRRADSLRVGDRILVRGRFFTDFQRQIVLGSLLGDAHLQGLKGPRFGSCQISFVQGNDQKAYLDFKIAQFPGLFSSKPHAGSSGYTKKTVWNATMNLVDEIDDLIPVIVRDGKVFPGRQYLDLLDARGMAIWYLDNGSLHIAKCGTAYVSLHTERFDVDTNHIIAEWLQEKLGGDVRIQKHKQYAYIRLNKDASARFLDMVEPYIPQCMAYKHRKPESALFNPDPESMVDVGEVEIKHIQAWEKEDAYSKHVYDIGIEGLHNYIAGNVVVHNSMVDLDLANALFSALPSDMQTVLVGDIDQLPSVGPGSVLRDAIDSGVVPTTRLEYNYRQAAGSTIALYAHKICRGETPDLAAKAADFVAYEANEAEDAVNLTLKMVEQALAEGYTASDFQVLTPMRKTPTGVHALNHLIREMVNPPAEGKAEMKYGGVTFRAGDKVMQVKNNYQKGVFNGDIGFITGIATGGGGGSKVAVRFDETVAEYEYSDLGELELAYASTVHKSQGSEFPLVICLCLRQHFVLLQRNLLYTGITRAKHKLVLIHQPRAGKKAGAVEIAIKNNLIQARNSYLAERLKG